MNSLLRASTICALLIPTVSALAQQPAINPKISIDQDLLLKKGYPFRKIIESGRHLFSTPFTKADGYGEGGLAGALGPRGELFEKKLQEFADAAGIDARDLLEQLSYRTYRYVDGDGGEPVLQVHPDFPYLRVNGLDSQSCFECHNSIGSENLADTESEALTRKPSANGGPAGFASNAFINDDLPYRAFTFIRNPPHVFGTGYAQKLAQEMSIDELLLQKALAIGQAVLNPGQRIEQSLMAKGVSFGTYAVTYTPPEAAPSEVEINKFVGDAVSAVSNEPSVDANGNDKPSPFTHDFSGVEGVSYDFVIRPFQWKGIASNERNFVRDAMRFHFGMLPVEIEKGQDEDQDGVYKEVTLGNVSALTIFTTMLRPPTQDLPKDLDRLASVRRGEVVFNGEAGGSSCASCHKPTLRIHDTTLVVRDPSNDESQSIENRGLSGKRRSSADLDTLQRFNRVRPALRKTEEAGRFRLDPRRDGGTSRRAMMRSETESDGFAFDLSLSNEWLEEHENNTPSLSLSYPRLPENADGSVDVPLFSDFKRHKMGSRLADIVPQETDVKGIFVPREEFLTRPLWGVADTGPWLHDGRAQSLRDAILLHKSPDSEQLVIDVITAFEDLSSSAQQDVVNFLLTLRLPIDGRYSFDEKP